MNTPWALYWVSNAIPSKWALHHPLIHSLPAYPRSLLNFAGAVFPSSTAPFIDDYYGFTKAGRVEANFSETTFKGHAVFSEITEMGWSTLPFDGRANFRNATFEEGATFAGTHFSGGADFHNAIFKKEADFIDTHFEREAYFVEAIFEGDTIFDNSDFESVRWTTFLRSTFKEEAYFHETFFDEGAFRSASFGKLADFSKSTFGREADFSKTTFGKDANFSEVTFKQDANFSEATFTEGGRFWKLTVPSHQTALNFRDALIEQPERFSVRSTHLRPMWFIDVDAQKFDFSDIVWFKLPNGDNLALKDEIKALEDRGVNQPESLRKLTRACRRLMNNAEENRDYPAANEFHYWSMEAQRKEGLSRLGLIATLYWILSGYGERPRRAFLFLVGLWAFFAFLYMVAGPSELKVFSNFLQDILSISARDIRTFLSGLRAPSPSEIKHFWADIRPALVYSLGALARLRPEPQPDGPSGFQFLVTAEGILGPLQIALLALAIRRQVMR